MISDSWRMPAEWELHKAYWLAWPHLAKEWGDHFESAKAATFALAKAIANEGKGEFVHLLVPTEDEVLSTTWPKGVLPIALPYGDTWLRDTAPIFTARGKGELAATCFAFNGWGDKYHFDGDQKVAGAITEFCQVPRRDISLVMEGGAVEVDGEGTLITTEQCLLNPNRNPGLSKAEIEHALGDALGVEQVLWLSEGLANDHTDGHVDTLVRFVRPGVVMAMEPSGPSDPNRDVLNQILKTLGGFSDHRERPLDVVRVPSPGAVRRDGHLLPASYANFVITNRRVIVPTYGSEHDQEAVSIIASVFPKREVLGLDAYALLTGGGAFHCVTQQEPAL